MRGTDKFLIGIVTGVVILVGIVLAVALLRPNQPGYQPDDTPEGAAHNYLLALQLKEYERAYGHLLPTLPGYPADLETFERDVRNNGWGFGYRDDDISLAIESVNASGDRAKIVARETRFYRGGLFDFYRGGLFDSGQYSDTFLMTLRREAGAWKVAYSERYWASCWESSQGCE